MVQARGCTVSTQTEPEVEAKERKDMVHVSAQASPILSVRLSAACCDRASSPFPIASPHPHPVKRKRGDCGDDDASEDDGSAGREGYPWDLLSALSRSQSAIGTMAAAYAADKGFARLCRAVRKNIVTHYNKKIK